MRARQVTSFLLVGLAAAACGGGSKAPAPAISLDSLCGLTAEPHATYEQRRAVLTDAQKRVAAIGGFQQTAHNKAINKAVADVIAAIDVETPPDWVGAPLPHPASIPTVSTAFQHLAIACR